MKTKRVLIDNGHGRNTPGKQSPDASLREYAYTREIAARLQLRLSKAGIQAELLVPEETDVPLSERCRRANKYKASEVILISIHCNAAGSGAWMQARGWEAWTSVGQTESDRIATYLCEAASRNLIGMRMRTDLSDGDPDKESQFYILKNTNCPAVLTENLFQDNESDVNYLLSEKGKTDIVNLHVEGIMKYFESLNA